MKMESMVPEAQAKPFDRLKDFEGRKYAGMRVGASHNWDYTGGTWTETKLAPDLWEFSFDCVKGRHTEAPIGSGAPDSTEYHWFMAADQRARKLDANHYKTMMTGLKLKVGHKRPKWRKFSYEYPDQKGAEERKVEFLQDVITRLEERGEMR
jgi:hypothetical protein